MTDRTTTTVRTFSGKQLAELKKLFANHEITHLGLIEEDGCIIAEYEEITWLTDDAERWHMPPIVTLKTIAINR